MNSPESENPMQKLSGGTQKACRLCLGQELLINVIEQGDLHQWISRYLSIVIQKDGNFSWFICGSCQTRLTLFRDFQQLCLGVQNELNKKLANRNKDDAISTIIEPTDWKTIKHEPDSDGDEGPVCRLCLSKKGVAYVLGEGDLHQLVSDYLSIVITMEDSISWHCCICCKTRIEEFRAFRIRCLEVQTQLCCKQEGSFEIQKDDDQRSTEVIKTTIAHEKDENEASENPEDQSVECKVCHKIIKSKKNLTDALRYHMVTHGPRKYSCTVCSKTFVKSFNFKEHMKIHNKTAEASERVECGICGKIFKNQTTLRMHKASHGPKKHVCSICGKAYALRQSFRLHMETHNDPGTLEWNGHHSDHPYKCQLCHKVMKNKIALQQHKKVHQPGKHVCPICSMIFLRRRDISDHMATHSASDGTSNGQDNEEYPFRCELCPKAYKRSYSLLMHKKNHKPKEHVCSICGKEFVHRPRLDLHMKIHDTHLEFDQTEQDNYHSDHAFECDLCPKIFHFQQELSKHVSNVHKRKKNSLQGEAHDSEISYGNVKRREEDVDQTEYPFKCSVCRKSFKLEEQLLKHKMKILAKLKYECPVCRKRYVSRGLLDQHMKNVVHAEGTSLNEQVIENEDDVFEAEQIKVEVGSDDDE